MTILEFPTMSEKYEATENLDAEQAFLGALLSNNDWIYRLPADFTAECFSDDLHSQIFDTISVEVDSGRRADPITLKGRFGLEHDTDSYLMRLVAVAITVIDIKPYAELLIENYRKRQMMDACMWAVRSLSDTSSEVSVSEVAATIASRVDDLTAGKQRYQVSTEKEVTERIVHHLQSNDAPSSSTGIPILDTAMDGGMYAGKLYGLVARKKMGKTMMLGTISTNLKNAGEKHLYLALEMGSDEIQQRSLAMQFGNYTKAFRTQGEKSIHFVQRVADYATASKNVRYYLDAPGLTFNDLRHVLPLYIRKYGIKGFILDCWQLVGGKAKNHSMAEHQDHVAQWLAETCKKYKVWGLVSAQENQDGNTRGGEGLRMACDQAYRLCKADPSASYAWMELMDTRYTAWNHVGDENNPRLMVSEKGTHFIPIGGN